MSRRLERVASAIRRIIAEAIQHELADPRVAMMTSVTRVTISPDLSVAKVFVSVMAPAGKKSATIRALQHARGHLRTLVAADLQMRQVPELVFQLDESLQKAAATIELLDRTLAEDRARRGENAAASEGEPPDDQFSAGDDSAMGTKETNE